MLTMILAASTFTFPGGSAAELCQAIADATGRPAVVAYMGVGKIRAAEFGWSDPTQFKSVAKSYFQFQPTTGDALGFGLKSIPEWLLDAQSPANVEQGGAATAKDGTVDATPEKGKYLSGHTVQQLALSKPLKMHWLLADMPMTLAAKSAPEKEFLGAVASAVGGKLDTADGYSIQPDPKLLRDKVVGGYRGMSAKAASKSQAALYALDADFISSLNDADTTAQFATPNSLQVKEGSPGSTLYASVYRFAQAYVAEQGNRDRRGERERTMVDVRQPVRVTFRPRQGVAIAFLGADGQIAYRLPDARRSRPLIASPVIQGD